MSRRRTGVGIVGVGVISAEYVRTLQAAPDVEVRFMAARQADRARARAEELGVPAFGTCDELLRDPSIEVVVNLTVPQVHAEITEQALDSGRHVYSEKPLALAASDGRRLVDLAASRGLRLGCAPDTFQGAALQTALRTIRSGEIGTPVPPSRTSSTAARIFGTPTPSSCSSPAVDRCWTSGRTT